MARTVTHNTRSVWEDMRVWKRLVAVLALVCTGGYIFADAWDIVPGPFTNTPKPADPKPYPTIQHVSPTAPAPLADVTGTPPSSEPVSELIASLESDSRNTGAISVVVADSLTGEPIATWGADRPAVPASNMKIVTAVAALHALGPETTLPTIASLSGTTVHLIGGGDVLLAGGAGEETATTGRAGLADLAADTASQLQDRGVSLVNIAVDSSLFTGPQYHRDIEGVDRSYVMELRPIAVDRGRVDGVGYLANPDLVAGEAFAESLRDQGIEVTTVERSSAPADAAELARVESAPVREIVDYMLVTSDNSVAEVLGHLVGIESGLGGSFDGANEARMRVLADLGVGSEGAVLADSSGLSTSNRLTANLLLDLLNHTWECDACSLAALPSGLPVGALDGTLTQRFHGTDIEGQVRAKTGTLVRAISLAGYMLTDSGYPLTFVILMDDLEPGTAPASRVLQDEFLDALAKL
ncbi:D-alanyl-D-alanine carboxypeptidase/D-alanyl-D-alanine-endopeptidase (penicillin-binding protein 4) [Trueperella bonasi]|uniref:D-alanyl-D-alanine carboxypeptidase/D-alanyl-D-alanine-endopeptidase (Penicillin-binding protein 4) n=1 Tax=Trueperella bonasi TaxID=312286 RepID=A0ABT9NGV3_9ACTO|nr:D-alanyl-D-alanine carboxypeptidase/D-alanyl-D-alanine-endopeptidase [Trueperella bonasi]MDP9806634.1 D-alanyl-D-alanine carboxypeptidase/D-alanyl-D-alanine-endopeptidase (penicillin-binding protein 4) [Trueperella bonasi]